MSELSRLLDDVYRTTIADGPPAWSSDDALDEAFADWVPGPPDEAPAAERAYVTDEPAIPAGDEAADATPSFERLFATGPRADEEAARAGDGADTGAGGAMDRASVTRSYLPLGTGSAEPFTDDDDTVGTAAGIDYDNLVIDTVANVDHDTDTVGTAAGIDYDNLVIDTVANVDHDTGVVANVADEFDIDRQLGVAVTPPAPGPDPVTAPTAVTAVAADVAAPDAVATTVTATAADAPRPPRWQPSDDDILPARKRRRLRRR